MEQQSIINYSQAIKAIKSAILQSRYRAAALANREMLSLYYGIGKFISENSREGTWGTNTIEVISQQLQQELPGLRGFSASNMKRMRQFYETWNENIPNRPLITGGITNSNRPLATNEIEDINRPTLSGDLKVAENKEYAIRPMLSGEICTDLLLANRQAVSDDLENAEWKYFLSIGFSQHCEILAKTKTLDERLFYIQKCATEFWSYRSLQYHLKSDLFHKQGTLPNNFKATISDINLRQKALLSFKDEYLLDYINIEAPYDEPDERVLETAIVNNIKNFILSLGKDFSFIGNQYRMIIEEQEYFIDLLFFNRQLQCLVAIELKRGEFKPEYLGKMNFYLSALDDLVRLPHESHSIGIILCKSQKQGIVEYAFRDMSKPMGVATYNLSSELPEQYRGILPDSETLKQLL
ncbi:MAG: PDDEXK nuclease domain-containing protein [Candidatus Symbiothrix sp.]|jgi:predicted nuclease of restriction endonuclease-like (RecB) superfamily|nr:PDDEXK nuclease domain-containing protein [Candidatus Symbiothrix sp.]